jgi:bacteriorhodopsin
MPETTPTDLFSSTLVHLDTAAEATDNLKAIFGVLRSLGSSELIGWAEQLPTVLTFLARLGRANCLDIATAVVATRVAVLTGLEQHATHPKEG